MKRLVIVLLALLLIPFNVLALDNDDTLVKGAKSGILIDANSGKIIYEKEKDKELAVASMTKMVAQIVILEEIEKIYCEL